MNGSQQLAWCAVFVCCCAYAKQGVPLPHINPSLPVSSSSRSPMLLHASSATAAVLSSLSQYGFAVLSLADKKLLTALQAEAAAVLEQAEARMLADGLDAEDAARQMGCVFQVLPELLDTQHPARSYSPQYWQLRSAWPWQQAVAAALQLQPLVQLLQAVLGCHTPLLYNEQYIIKPPHMDLGSSFGWHCDSQYASSTGRGVSRCPYLSLWVALDDMTANNGCLIVLPGRQGRPCGCLPQSTHDVRYIHTSNTEDCLAQLSTMQPQPQPASSSARQLPPTCGAAGCSCGGGTIQAAEAGGSGLQPAVGLTMPAGTAVIFWDDLWHCSGPNRSSHTRSAYMVQFSAQPLTWQDTGELVGLAVPLAAASA